MEFPAIPSLQHNQQAVPKILEENFAERTLNLQVTTTYPATSSTN